MCVAFAQNPCVRIQIEFNMTLFCDFSKFKWTFLSAQYHRAELKCFYGEIQEAWHVLCFPVAVFFMWHFHFNLRDFYTICMQTHIYTFTLPSLQCKWHHIFNIFNKTEILFIWYSPLNCGKDGWYVDTLFCNILNYAMQYTR